MRTTGLDSRLFPDMRYGETVYTHFADDTERAGARLCRYPFLAAYEDAMRVNRRLMLIGEGSIGKSTNLRLLEADLLAQGIPAVLVECKDIRGGGRVRLAAMEAELPDEAVVLLDAWDEVKPDAREEALYIVHRLSVLSEAGRFRLVMSSRFDPQQVDERTEMPADPAFPEAVFEKVTVEPFSDKQIRSIVGTERTDLSHLVPLLGNTMFMLLYLFLRQNRATEALSEVKNQGQFLRYYFHRLVQIKQVDRYTDERSVDEKLVAIGERVYRQVRGLSRPTRISDIPQAWGHIFEEVTDERGQYGVEASHSRYVSFCLGMFWKERLTQKEPDVSVMEFTDSDYEEGLWFANELMSPIEQLNCRMLYKRLPYNNRVRNASENIIVRTMMEVAHGRSRFSVDLPDAATTLWTYMFATFESFAPEKAWAIDITYREGTLKQGFAGLVNYLFQVDFPNIQTVEKAALSSSRFLTNVHLPQATVIGEFAFAFCEELRTVRLPQVRWIRSVAFSHCKALTHIDLPAAVDIGLLAFSDCTALESVHLSAIRRILSHAFQGCDKFQTIHYDGTAAEWSRVLKADDFDHGLSSYEVVCSDQVLSVTKAVREGDGTTETPTPETQEHAFIDDILSWHNKHRAEQLGTKDLPRTLALPTNAFAETDVLVKVDLPKVTRVGMYGFENCRNLQTLRLAAAKVVDERGLAGCARLSSVYLPEVVTLGARAFEGCVALGVVVLPQANDIGDAAFRGCTGLSKITLSAVTALRAEVFAGCEALCEIHCPHLTKKEWEALPKEAGWDEGTPMYTVFCANGEVKKPSGRRFSLFGKKK